MVSAEDAQQDSRLAEQLELLLRVCTKRRSDTLLIVDHP